MGNYAQDWDCNSANDLTTDWNGNLQVVLRNPQGASAMVSVNSGQVMSWRNSRGEELLFTSSKAIFKDPKAMRGGISIGFPQFGKYGFSSKFEIDGNPHLQSHNNSSSKSFIDLILKSSTEDLKYWPNSFEYRLRVALASDGSLSLISRIRNVNEKPFSFSFAYNAYFSVSDISEVRVEGLETLDYLDNLFQKQRCTEQGDALTFESEVDRVYLSCPNAIAMIDHEKKRTIVIRKKGLPDVVVWNPWQKKSKAMLDLGDDEYKQMLSVDGAVVEHPITLKPREEWTGQLDLKVVPSSFCSEYL